MESSWEAGEEGWDREAASDVELMRQAWRNEKAAPEVLGFEGALVRRLREQIELQVIISSHLISPFVLFNLMNE
jgi:GINS complex subunit 4